MTDIDYSHIHKNFRHIALLPNNERIAFIDTPRWIGYSRANEVIEVMQGLMNKVKQHRMPNLLLIGDSNNGKTTIIQDFAERFGESYSDEHLVVPVCLIQAPPSANEKDLYISLINYFALPYRSSDSAGVLRAQAVHTLRETHVKILIIDEVHSMLTGTARQQRLIMNAIKYLCNALQLPIVLCGTKDAVRILHTDPQHASRFDVAELPLWQNDKEFRRLVGSFERILPLKKPSNLTEISVLNLIYSISGGNIGNIKRLINECAIEAIESGEERITGKMIEDRSWLRPTKGLRKILG